MQNRTEESRNRFSQVSIMAYLRKFRTWIRLIFMINILLYCIFYSTVLFDLVMSSNKWEFNWAMPITWCLQLLLRSAHPVLPRRLAIFWETPVPTLTVIIKSNSIICSTCKYCKMRLITNAMSFCTAVWRMQAALWIDSLQVQPYETLKQNSRTNYKIYITSWVDDVDHYCAFWTLNIIYIRLLRNNL